MSLPVRARCALLGGRAAALASRLAGRGRGQVVGGQVMLALDPHALTHLSRDRAITVVSATNGKSTTTRFIAEALRTLGAPVAFNPTGANMESGIVTALADGRRAPRAALEVDEAHLPAIVQQTRPATLVLMNLSRDQLDRGSEVKMLAQRWRTMMEDLTYPCHVVANADDPLVVWAVGDTARVTWVGCGQWWWDDADLCPQCAHTLVRPRTAADHTPWYCPACSLRRPDTSTSWQIVGGQDGHPYAVRTPKGNVVVPPLRLPGRVNVGNAAIAAAAVADQGVAPATAFDAFGRVRDVDGRYLAATWFDHPVRLLLGKNPASWTELIDVIEHPASAGSPHALVIAINARGADGRDPSWLWDVPFERLAGVPVWAAGERRFDLAVRLDVAGLDIRGVVADPLEALASIAPGQSVDIVANYTAFQLARARLSPRARSEQNRRQAVA